MYYVGCDQHKEYSFVVVKDQNGSAVNQTKLYHADKDNINDYFNALPKDSVAALAGYFMRYRQNLIYVRISIKNRIHLLY